MLQVLTRPPQPIAVFCGVQWNVLVNERVDYKKR